MLGTGSGWRGRETVALGVASFALLTFYEVTAVGNRSEADDAFCFAYGVEQEPLTRLVASGHVQHLLYLPLMRMLHNLGATFGFDIRAYDLMRHASTVAAALSVVLFALFLRDRLGLTRFAATSASAGLAVSYGFWRYANEAEVYSLAILLVVGLLHLTFRREGSLASAALAGGVAAGAILVHVLSVVPAVVAVPVIWFRGRRAHLPAYLLTAALVVGAVTYVTYRHADPPAESYGNYLLSTEPGTGRSPRLSVGGALQSPAGFGQAVATGNFLFSYGGVTQRLRAAIPAKTLTEESYAGEQADAVVRVVPPVALALVTALSLLVVGRVRGRIGGGGDPRLKAVLAWAAAYWLVVTAAGSALAAEAWTPLLVALWILVGASVFQHVRRRPDQVLVVGLLAALFAHNFFGGFWMMRDERTDYNAAKSRWLVEQAGPDDAILTADTAVFLRYLRYHTPADVYQLQGLSLRELDELYSDLRGAGDLYATASVFDPPAEFSHVDQSGARALARFGTRISAEFVKVHSDEFGEVYLRFAEESTSADRAGDAATRPRSPRLC